MPARSGLFLCPDTTMKTIFCMMLIAVMLTPHAKALFGHTAAEKDRRIRTEQQLAQEQQRDSSLIQSNEQLHVVIFVIGAAIGSRTRRECAK